MDESNLPLGSLPQLEFPKLYSWSVLKKSLSLRSSLRFLVIAFMLLTILLELPMAFSPWGALLFLTLAPCLAVEFFVRLAGCGGVSGLARRGALLAGLWLTAGLSMLPLLFPLMLGYLNHPTSRITASLLLFPIFGVLSIGMFFGQYFPLLCAEGMALREAVKRSFQLILPHWLELGVAYFALSTLAYAGFMALMTVVVSLAAVPMVFLKWSLATLPGMAVFILGILAYIGLCMEMSTCLMAFYLTSFHELKARLQLEESIQQSP